MRKQETVEVEMASGPGEVTLTAMDGNTGGLLGVKLAQLFGPGIVALFAAMETNDMTKVSEGANMLLSKLSPEEFEKIKGQLLAGAQAALNGEFHNLDKAFIGEEFSGNLGSLLKLIIAALKLNFRNFFEGLGIKKESIAKLMSPKKTAPAKSPATSSGPSGD